MIEILLFGGILLGAFLFCERGLNELTGGIAALNLDFEEYRSALS